MTTQYQALSLTHKRNSGATDAMTNTTKTHQTIVFAKSTDLTKIVAITGFKTDAFAPGSAIHSRDFQKAH